jgi:hypothetical protein
MEGGPKLKLILVLSLGFVFVTSLSALASSRYGKNFFKNFGRASVATWHDVVGEDNFKLAAEVEITPATTSSNDSLQNNLVAVVPLKQSKAPVQNKIANITSSIIAAVASSPIIKEIKKIPEEILAATTSAIPPPVLQISSTSVKIPESTSTPQARGHIVIYKIQISGANTVDDLIMLFNPNWEQLDMSGWQLKKKTKSGTSAVSIRQFPSGSIIPGKGVFIWASSEDETFPSGVNANVWSKQTIAVNNSIVLLDKDDNQVDAVAWGNGTNQYVEGSALLNPESGQLIIRKFNADIPIDTNDNLSDFEIK